MLATGSLKRNILSNWLVLATSIGFAFIITPVIVRSLAAEQYGVWAFLNGLMSYTELFYLGLGSALVKNVARYRATGDMAGLNRVASVVVSIYGLIGVVCLIGGFALSPFVSRIFAEPLTPAASQAASVSCILLGIQLLCVFVGSAFSGVLIGYDRYDLVNAIVLGGIAVKFLTIPLLVGSSENQMVMLAIVTTVVAAISTLAMAVVVFRFVPQFGITPTRPRADELQFLYGFGLQSFLIVFSVKLISYTDTAVIGFTLGATSVAIYALPLQLVEYSRAGISGLAGVLLPRLTVHVAKGDMGSVREAFLDSVRIALCLAGWLGATLVATGPLFLDVWVGTEYGGQAVWIVIFLCVAMMTHVVASQVPLPFYQALNIVGFPAFVLLCEAGVNLCLSILLAPRLGLFGVALATAGPAVLISGLILPRFACRRLGIRLSTFAASAVLPGLVVLVGTLLCQFAIAQVFTGATYVSVVLRVVASAPVGATLGLWLLPRAQRVYLLDAVGLGRLSSVRLR